MLFSANGNTYPGGFTLSAGTMIVGGVNAMGNGGALNINGGAIGANNTRNITARYSGINIGGDFQFGVLSSAVSLASDTANITFADNVALGAATRTVTLGGAANYTFGGIISGASGVGLTIAQLPSASGKITLTGVNTFNGATTISGGTLLVNGSLVSGSSVSVASAGKLGGTGTVNGTVVVNGTIAPGASVGQLNTGSQIWASGGTNVWEIVSLSGGSGVGWDFLNITGDLTITATNKPSDLEKFTIKLVSMADASTPGPMGTFNNAVSNAWPIATVSGSVNEFIVSKFNVNATGFQNPLGGGSFSVRLENRTVFVVFTPSACAGTTTPTSQVVGTPPNTQMEMTFVNASFLKSVQALVTNNCYVTGTAYAADNSVLGSVAQLSTTARTILPDNTAKVVLTATKYDTALSAIVNVIAIDTCGRGVSFDPIITTLEVLARNRVQQRFEGLMSAEHYFFVQNGRPGLRRLEVNINGRGFGVDLVNGQSVSSDLRRAMREGTDNVVTLTGYGEVGSSAFVTLTDTPTGPQQELAETVLLTLGQTESGLALTWPETLTGWQLQSSATADTDWTDVTAPPAAVNGQWTLTVPTTGGTHFYRLHGPVGAGRNATDATPGVTGATISVPSTTQPQPLKRTYDGILW